MKKELFAELEALKSDSEHDKETLKNKIKDLLDENESLAKTLLDERDLADKDKADLVREFNKREQDLKCKQITFLKLFLTCK